jgi:hypothetical protein
MLRYVPLAIWFALTIAFVAMSLSQFLFGARDWHRLGRKLGLSLVWPLALLSSAGRRILLDEGRDL